MFMQNKILTLSLPKVSAHCTRVASPALAHLTDRVKLSEPYYNDLSGWSKAPTRSHESAYK